MRRYTRLTLLSMVPVVAMTPTLATFSNGASVWRSLPLLAGLAVLVPVHWKRIARAIETPMEVPPARPSVVTLVVSTVLMVYGYVYADPGNVLWVVLPAMSITELQFGRTPADSWRRSLWFAVGFGALVGGIAALSPFGAEVPLPATAITVFLLLVFPFGELIGLRQWRIAIELDQARRDAAELGATRERLRLAEDLHDILGHALEVVSLKSELATRLGKADPDRAHAEMAEVQKLARGALQDVRELAQGRRQTDLDTELAGARTLLASAGIDCAVDIEAADQRHSELFGRVLREAVTNLLRHADTRRCWITVRPAALTVVNDGVTDTPPRGDGTGLASLTRRVRAAGGEFTAGPGKRPGTFEVSAVLA